MATCKNYLDFEPTDNPKWRKGQMETDSKRILTTSEMISEILAYRNTLASSIDNVDKNKKHTVERELLIPYLLNVEYQDVQKIEEMMRSVDLENNKGIQRQVSNDLGSSEDYVGSEDNLKGKREIKTFELPAYPSLGDTEDKISSTYKSIAQNNKPAKGEQEAKNLYRAYKNIAKDVQMVIDDGDIGRHSGLMEVETYIRQTHKILMDNIMHDQLTGPGTFSIKEKYSDLDGVIYYYPHFQTQELVHAALQMLVDKYNAMNDEIRSMKESDVNDKETLELSFKCSSLFFCGFLSLHPFGDGNGRLARLLCSYSLLTVSPFLSPIYNVFSSTNREDYLQSLKDAGKGQDISQTITTKDDAEQVTDKVLRQKPSDLCALIIESNWAMWKEYLKKLGILKT